MDSSANINQTSSLIAENTIVFPSRDPSLLAFQDFYDGLKDWRIWLLLAYQDIKLRYRRSVLGPFWITISMAITVYSMGLLYSHLFHANLEQYYPFLVAGMLSWALLSNVVYDLVDTYVISDGLIKQIKLPYTLYIHRITMRHIIIFFHNLLVMVPIFLIFHHSVKINFATLLLIPNLFIIYLNIFIYGLALAMIGARFRDLSQVIKSLIQVAFFVTPVMWNPIALPQKYQLLLNLNPFYTYVELIREPLIGKFNSPLTLFIAFLITAIGIAICAPMFSRYRARIIYWL